MKDWYVSVGFTTATAVDEDTMFEFSGRLGGAPMTIARDFTAGSIGVFVTATDITEAWERGVSHVLHEADDTIGALTITRVDVMTEEEWEREADAPVFPDVVSYAEIARMAGVTRQAARDYAKGSTFPPAVITTAQGPLYAKASVEAWLENRKNRTHRKELATA